MKREKMYFDTQRVKLYKNVYRPSSNISRFVRTLLAVILEGHSPQGDYTHHQARRKR
jgi:hypothetical protein